MEDESKNNNGDKNRARDNGRYSRADDKHRKIIDAAVKVFAEYGFHNSKISQIAKEAGVADGTIYLYFKNKDDILITLFEEKLGEIIERITRDIANEQDPVAKLRLFINYHLSMMESYQDLAEVLTVELRQSHKFMKEYIPEKFAEYLKVISAIIREGKDKGVFAEDLKPGIVKRALFGALDEIALEWLLAPKKKYNMKTSAAQISEIFLNGIINKKKGDSGVGIDPSAS